MTNPLLPMKVKNKNRSEAAKRMWDRRKSEEASFMNEKKLDWHLFWTAAGVVITLAALIIGSYISILSRINDSKTELSREISDVNAEIVKIQTVLILKGIAPKDLFSAQSEDK